jgi:hypothetical protein
VPSGLNEKGDGLGKREGKGRRIYAERKLAEGFHADEVNPIAAAVMCCCLPPGEQNVGGATRCPETAGK